MPVTPEQIRQLAEIYDRSVDPLDALSRDSEQAEHQFGQMLARLHGTFAPDADPREFRREAIRQCKLYLKKNR
ncbi:MAG: hypothetical protein LBK99_05605 [Opitutaceae bacterium]|jgi:hypothetical protein|nr:hypothetical protein [Opitutaceae bacterium]